MTFGAAVILLTQLITLAIAAFAAWTAWRGERVSRGNAAAVQKNTEITHRLEINVDGRLSELLALTATASKAEGVIEGEANSTAKK